MTVSSLANLVAVVATGQWFYRITGAPTAQTPLPAISVCTADAGSPVTFASHRDGQTVTPSASTTFRVNVPYAAVERYTWEYYFYPTNANQYAIVKYTRTTSELRLTIPTSTVTASSTSMSLALSVSYENSRPCVKSGSGNGLLGNRRWWVDQSGLLTDARIGWFAEPQRLLQDEAARSLSARSRMCIRASRPSQSSPAKPDRLPTQCWLIHLIMKKLSDVDIMDITDPRNPRPIAEYDLNTRFPQIIQPELGTGASFFHDVVVKQFNGRFIMLPSKPVAPQVFQNPGAIAIVQQRPRPTPTPPR